MSLDLVSEEQSNKRKCSPKDQPQRGIEILPRDITMDILSRLRLSSIMQSRVVSRDWKMLSHDPYLVKMHFSRTAKNNNSCLILHFESYIHTRLYYVELSDQIVREVHLPFYDVIPRMDVIGSCNGLLCISASSHKSPPYICNPLTKEYKEMPNSTQFRDQEVVFGFGFHPKTSEYKVVKIVYCCEGYNREPRRYGMRAIDWARSEVLVYTLGSNTWRVLGQPPSLLQIRQSFPSLVSGRLIWLAQSHGDEDNLGFRIVSFDLADEIFNEVPGPDCGDVSNRYRCKYHLVVLGGCLCVAIHYDYQRLEIWVMKEYNVKDSWIKEFVIRSYSLQSVKPKAVGLRWLRKLYGARIAQVVCLLENGNILVAYRDGALVSHNAEKGTFKRLIFQGIPDYKLSHTIVHMGCLNSVDNPILMNVE